MAVRTRGKRVVIDFRCDLPDGRRVRCVESEGEATDKNLERAEYKWRAIQYALKYGSFNYLDHFPYGSKAKHFKQGPEPMLFSSWWERWLAGQAARPNTVKWWRSVYNRHFEESFGDVFIQAITEHEIRVFRRRLLDDKGLRENSVNAIVKALCQCLRRAKREGFISFDPCEDLRRLKEGKAVIAPFTFDELNHLIITAENKAPELTDMIILWSRTGLRPGEIFGLKWSDIDYFNEAMNIRRTMHRGGREGKPKTVSSERTIPLRTPALEALKRQEAGTGLMGSYVFLNHKGGAIMASTFALRWAHLLRIAGLSYRSPKQMRHTFATLHLAAGESVTWVAMVLGHSNAKVTFDYYNAYVPNLTREDGSAFERVMEARSGNNLVTEERKSLILQGPGFTTRKSVCRTRR